MAIATAAAPAVVGAVASSVVAGCERLPVIIAKAASDARGEPSLVHRAKRMVELQFEAFTHASDDVIHEPQADLWCRLRIVPREVFVDELDDGLVHGPGLAFGLDRNLVAIC